MDEDGNNRNAEGLSGGGTGSFGCLFAPFAFQADIWGDDADLEPEARTIGGGGHIGLLDPALGYIGANGGFQDLNYDKADNDDWRVGGEGEFFLDSVTLGVSGGYFNNEDWDEDGWYGRGLWRLYATEDFKLEGAGGVVADIPDGRATPIGRALVEYRIPQMPLSVFARWEGQFDEEWVEHLAVAGVRLYLVGFSFDAPPSLREMDRRYFRDNCLGAMSGSRIC